MNIEYAVAALDGCEYPDVGDPELFSQMADAGLVAVFGGSDDLMEFRGAIYDENTVWACEPAYVTRAGLVELCECECDAAIRENARKLKGATPIEAIWSPPTGESWIYKTDIPHQTFQVMEDGEVYCTGILFRLADVPEVAE